MSGRSRALEDEGAAVADRIAVLVACPKHRCLPVLCGALGAALTAGVAYSIINLIDRYVV